MKYLLLALTLALVGCYGYFERPIQRGEYGSMSDARYAVLGSLDRMGYKIDDIDSDRIITKWRGIVIYTNNRPIIAGQASTRIQRNGMRAMRGQDPLPRLNLAASQVLWRFIVEFKKGKTKVTAHCLQQHIANLQVSLYWLPCYDEDVRAMVDSTAKRLAWISPPKG